MASLPAISADGAATSVRLRRAAPGLLAAALAVAYLLWQPPSIDLAAAEYRSWLFGRERFALYDLHWYGGHHLLPYSVLLPPLGWLLGPRLLAALCAVAAAVLFDRLARLRFGAAATAGSLWFAAGTATILLSGRITFALGLVPALGALLALAHAEDRRPRTDAPTRRTTRRRALVALACALAIVTALASPVAAAFLALAGAARALAALVAPRPRAGTRDRRLGPAIAGTAVAASAALPVLALTLAFPQGGVEPFVVSAFLPAPAVAALALRLVPREQRTIRVGVVLYAAVCAAVFVLDTPVGGNVTRLGALCAGPVLALVLWPHRRLALALVALPLAFWQWTAAVRDVAGTVTDPTVDAAFHAPLIDFLDRARARGEHGRVEIPFTATHWEARHVAAGHALARGWLRQLDHAVNRVFYDGELTPVRYRAWLRRQAVRWVALPDAALDYSAQAEARLIRAGQPYLREAWRGGAWRVYAVRDPAPLVEGPARIVALGHDTVTLAVRRPGRVHLRARWTPYWHVARGRGCVAPGPAGQTWIDAHAAGELRLTTRFAVGRIGATSPRCSR